MRKIFLYLKTHNKTGLKYLGKTSRNPETYKGSGLYWLNHLRKHGYDVTTEILFESIDKSEIQEKGIYYSELWDIVKNPDFANLRLETGDGGDTSNTAGYLRAYPKMCENKRRCRWWNNGIHSVHRESPPDETYQPGRGRFNNVGAKKGSEIQKGKHWINNGIDEMMFDKHAIIPSGFRPGRIESPKKGKPNMITKGSHWWNNGVTECMSVTPPDDTYNRGRLTKCPND